MSVEKTPPVMTLYADDYLSYDLSHKADTIVSNSDTISLYFKTSQPNALLFYTGMRHPLHRHRTHFTHPVTAFASVLLADFSCLVLFCFFLNRILAFYFDVILLENAVNYRTSSSSSSSSYHRRTFPFSRWLREINYFSALPNTKA